MPHDTTPEAHAIWFARWKSLTPEERATEVMEWWHVQQLQRYHAIKAAHPEASDREVIAL